MRRAAGYPATVANTGVAVNVVIFTDDMQPINCIDMPIEVIDKAVEDGGLRLRLRDTPEYCTLLPLPVITVEGKQRYLFVTPHETQALKLTPTWLPGQQGSINHAKQHFKRLLKKKPPPDNVT